MLAGYPQFTEDVIPGRGRVVQLEEFGGKKLVDESIQLALDYDAQDSFWVKDSSALHVRAAGTRTWHQRKIKGLPRYNDYVGEGIDVVWADGVEAGSYPLDMNIKGDGDDLTGLDVRVTGYLRYAQLSEMLIDGGAALEPVVDVQILTAQGALPATQLWANDEIAKAAFDGRLEFRWAETEADIEALRTPYGRTMSVRVEGMAEAETVQLTQEYIDEAEEEPFIPIGDDGYAYRVTGVIDRLPIDGQGEISGLIMEFRRPDGGTLSRWVFEDPALTRDLDADEEGEQMHTAGEVASDINATYDAGRWAIGTIIAGPGDLGLRLLLGGDWQEVDDHALTIGEAQRISEGQSLVVTRLLERATPRRVPMVVPPSQRNRDFDISRDFAMIRVSLSEGDWHEDKWLVFHKYSFEDSSEMTPMLGRFQPEPVTLRDGREIELMFAREKQLLPSPVSLDDFFVTARVGGFQGTTASVRDWTSSLRFKDGDTWSDIERVSTNDPRENHGFWYFQSYWEPPRRPSANDPGSGGLNFTGLGVGTRTGVRIQLAGCTLSVMGMIWAWYIKPIIRRKRRERVLVEHADAIAEKKGNGERELVGAGQEVAS
jgi:hypothetical protein